MPADRRSPGPSALQRYSTGKVGQTALGPQGTDQPGSGRHGSPTYGGRVVLDAGPLD